MTGCDGQKEKQGEGEYESKKKGEGQEDKSTVRDIKTRQCGRRELKKKDKRPQGRKGREERAC